MADANNQETMSYSNHLITPSPFDNVIDYQINNPTSSQHAHDAAHHVSVCVNDLHTTLFIDEDALNSTKTTNNNSSSSKGMRSYMHDLSHPGSAPTSARMPGLLSMKKQTIQLSRLAAIKTFIDRIIRRLQHFKRSLDSGLSKYK